MSESVVPAALRVAYSKGIRAARTFAASTPLPPAQRQFVRRSPESCGCIRRQLLDAVFGSEQKCLYAARKLARQSVRGICSPKRAVSDGWVLLDARRGTDGHHDEDKP